MVLLSEHIQAALRAVDPDGIQYRQRRKARRRAAFITEGPDQIWSIDGHDKLKNYGFQIYGGTDVYS